MSLFSMDIHQYFYHVSFEQAMVQATLRFADVEAGQARHSAFTESWGKMKSKVVKYNFTLYFT